MKTPKVAVRIRNGFSDRNNIKKENTDLQFKNLDDRARISLIRAISIIESNLYSLGNYQLFLRDILHEIYLLETKEGMSYNPDKIFELIYNTIRVESYDSVLSVIEYLASRVKNIPVNYEYYNYTEYINKIFEQEYVGYRFINGYITPITNDLEIKEIQDATNLSNQRVREHLNKALLYISNREKPDYENSIKESISAVEALCSDMLGKGATLGAALKLFEKNGLVIHPSLKSAFEKLYGYTSDASGIRHAGDIGGKSSTFEEARFMLVSCSGFINYLTEVYSKYGK